MRVMLTGGAVDLDTGVVIRGDDRVRLTTKERELLTYLADRPGDVVTREELLSAVWGYHPGVRSRAVDKTLTRLRAKLGDDGRDPLHLHTVHGAGYRFEPLRRTAALGVGLPPFVGRSAELGALEQALRDGARLVMVVGVAGVGKTRLLGEFAAHTARPVVACRAQTRVLDALTEQLELPVPADAAPADRLRQLGRALGARGAVLLMLDGVEQAVEELSQSLPELLQTAPDLQVVLSTRRALPNPEPWHRIDLHPLGDDDAVSLFLARARARRADFAFAQTSQAQALVKRLDRLPLAIELAAARVGVLTAGQLIQRLDRRFEILKGGLVSALDTSWELLTPEERAALSQAAVFEGGLSLEAAEAVLDVPDVLDALERLRDHSLLMSQAPDALPDGLRFFLYESVAHYARERGIDQATLDRHSTWCVETGERLAAGVQGASAARCLRQLQLEADNLAAVVRRETETHPVRAARATLALHPLRSRRGPVEEHLALLHRFARLPGQIGVRVRLAAAGLCVARGMWREAEALLDHPDHGALEGADRVDLLSSQAALQHRRGRVDQAEAAIREALNLARQTEDLHREARLLGTLGAVFQLAGRVAEAESSYRDALALHRRVGNRHHEATVLSNLSVLRVDHGGTEGRAEATGWLQDALAWAREAGDPHLESRLLGNLAAMELDGGDLDRAEGHAQRALSGVRLLGLPRSEAAVLGTFGLIAHLRGEAIADAHYRASLALARTAGATHLQGAVWCHLAALTAARGEIAVAKEQLAAAREAIDSSRRPHLEVVWRVAQGHLALARGDHAAAEACLAEGQAAAPSSEGRGALALLRRRLTP